MDCPAGVAHTVRRQQVSAESSKKPSVAAQAPAASQKTAVRNAVGVVDLASRAGWKRALCTHGRRTAWIAAPRRKGKPAGSATAAIGCPTWHSTRAPRLTVPSMAPSDAPGSD